MTAYNTAHSFDVFTVYKLMFNTLQWKTTKLTKYRTPHPS
jgi:hypothetical protein